jgi:hypothetical protein
LADADVETVLPSVPWLLSVLPKASTEPVETLATSAAVTTPALVAVLILLARSRTAVETRICPPEKFGTSDKSSNSAAIRYKP